MHLQRDANVETSTLSLGYDDSGREVVEDFTANRYNSVKRCAFATI
jgi:hypothetical protein